MNRKKARIFEDGNLYHRCVRVLIEKEYEVGILPDDSEDIKEGEKEVGFWYAKKHENEFYGANPLTLLGVVSMWEHLGDAWREKGVKNLYREILDAFYEE